MPFPVLPLVSALGPSLLQGVGSLLSSNATNRGALEAQKLANKQNIEFWHMQNQYNHPSAQMDRLKSAGLNPNLIYGTSPTSAVGSAGPIAPSKAAPYEMKNYLEGINLTPITAYADIKVKKEQANNLQAQNDVLIQEAILKASQTAQNMASTARSKFDLELASELRNTSVDAARESLRKLQADALGSQLDNMYKDQSMKDRLTDMFFRAQIAKASLRGVALDNELKSLEIELNKLGITKNDAWYWRVIGRNADVVKEGLKPFSDSIRSFGGWIKSAFN